jgi:hypothetical protein
MPDRLPDIPGLLSARRVRDAWLLTLCHPERREGSARAEVQIPGFTRDDIEVQENPLSFDEAALAYLHGEDSGVEAIK